MEYGKGSLGFGVRGLDDRRPAGNFALHQSGEWLPTPLCFGRNIAADIKEALAQAVVIECPVERLRQSVENRLRQDRKSTRLNSSHRSLSRMPSSA